MELDVSDLRAACYEVARGTMWDLRPIDASIIERHAEQLFTIAQNYEDYLKQQGRDPNIIARAVRYLAHVHAMPPMSNDVRWFTSMLMVLIELVCPNTVVSRDAEFFFRDIEMGIACARAEY